MPDCQSCIHKVRIGDPLASANIVDGCASPHIAMRLDNLWWHMTPITKIPADILETCKEKVRVYIDR